MAGAASAQSSVTLFGVVDAAISYYQTTSKYQTTVLNPFPVYAPDLKQSQWALSNSGYNSSRLGFRGTEDLGGGLSASFWLEAPLANDDSGAGSSAGFFSRRSTVSLSGGFGEVRLGRDYTATFWNDTVFDPFGTNGVGSSAIFFQSLGQDVNNANYVRKSNMIGYFLPANLGGFYGQVQYAFNENNKYDPGDTTPADITGYKSRTGRFAGGRLGYANGPLDIAIAYSSSGVNDHFYAGDTTNVDTGNLGASWDFGFLKLFGEYSRVQLKTDYSVVPLTGVSPDLTINGYLLGLTVPVGPGLIRASYSHVEADVKSQSISILNLNMPDPKADKFALGYVHNLSKRTALYATFAYTKNKNGARLANGGSPVFVNPTLVNLANGGAGYRADTAYGYDFGIRHSF